MKWTGHLIRLSDNTPPKTALKHLNKEKKKTSRLTKENVENNDVKKSKQLLC